MQSDTIKLLASTLTAVALVIGGMLLLTFVWMQPIEGKDGMMALLGGFIGMGATFLFQANAGTAAVRNFQSGLNTPVPVDPDAAATQRRLDEMSGESPAT